MYKAALPFCKGREVDSEAWMFSMGCIGSFAQRNKKHEKSVALPHHFE